MQNLHNYTEKICKQWGLEMYIVDQYADSKTSNCMLSLSENNDTPRNVDVPLRWVHAMLPLIKNKYYILGVCFGSLSCPSCNVHTPYCLMWHAQPYNIFPHSHKQHDLQKKKKVTEHKMCDFLYNFCLKHFSFYKELSEIWSQCILVFMLSSHYSFQILVKLEFPNF